MRFGAFYVTIEILVFSFFVDGVNDIFFLLGRNDMTLMTRQNVKNVIVPVLARTVPERNRRGADALVPFGNPERNATGPSSGTLVRGCR